MIYTCEHCDETIETQNIIDTTITCVWCIFCLRTYRGLLRDAECLDWSDASIDRYTGTFLTWTYSCEVVREIPKIKRYRIRRLKCLEKKL